MCLRDSILDRPSRDMRCVWEIRSLTGHHGMRCDSCVAEQVPSAQQRCGLPALHAATCLLQPGHSLLRPVRLFPPPAPASAPASAWNVPEVHVQ
eukprot:1178280-Prorocentrum_minimum.AAC.5